MSKLRQIYLMMMGLNYSSQVELVKDLREKDEDFVDSALEVSLTNSPFILDNFTFVLH